MRAEFAKVLYVVAYDHEQGKESDMRGPQAGHGLMRREISEELRRHFPNDPEMPSTLIRTACTVLLKQNYFVLKGGKSGKRYQLHEKLTIPTLITDRIDAKIVLLISELTDMEDRFALDYAVRECATKLGIPEEDVKRRIDARSQTINDVKGYFFQGQTGTYELNAKTVEEERPYLELVESLGFRTPRPVKARPAARSPRKRSTRAIAKKKQTNTRGAGYRSAANRSTRTSPKRRGRS